jgi:dTDP-4-amino-4,6-dideoxygalactose transaminase
MTAVPWSDYPALSAFAPAQETPELRALLRRTLALPYHPRMSDRAIDRTCQALLTTLDAKETST